MVIVDKKLCSGVLTGSNVALYTAPSASGAKVIIKSIAIANNSASAVPVTMKFGGIIFIPARSIPANDVYILSQADQIINASELIEGLAGTTDVVSYMISGKEITI